MKFKKTLLAIALSATAGFTTSAFAIPTTGGISFSINGSPFANGTDLQTVTAFDFYSLGTDVTTLGMTAVSVSGDFASLGITGSTDFTLNEFQFSPALAAVPTLVWESNDLALDFFLSSVSVTTRTATELTLKGKGYLQEGADTVEGNWITTINGLGRTFSFSSSTAVSEPGSLALLGLGLAGLGVARRKQKQ